MKQTTIGPVETSRPGRRKLVFWPIFLILLGLVLGFVITLQARSSTLRIANPLIPYASLRDTKEDLLSENQVLSEESAAMQKEISVLQNELKGTQTLDKTKTDALEILKGKTGLSEARGSGFEIILNDAPQFKGGSSSIAHAADLRDLIDALWDAGAGAIAVNDQRIVASTSIDCIVNTVMINNIRIVPPFRIVALGDKNYLEAALRDELKLKDLYERTVKVGLVFQFEYKYNLVVPAFSGNFVIEKAKTI